MGALEIRPKAPDSFVRAVSSSQVFEAAVVVKAGEHWARPPVLLLILKKAVPYNKRSSITVVPIWGTLRFPEQ